MLEIVSIHKQPRPHSWGNKNIMLYQTHTEWLSTPAAKILLERNNLDEIRPTEKAGEWIVQSLEEGGDDE